MGTRLRSRAANPFWSSMEQREKGWEIASPSSSPVCLARAPASFFSCASATKCLKNIRTEEWEEKFPAYRGFALPTHFQEQVRLTSQIQTRVHHQSPAGSGCVRKQDCNRLSHNILMNNKGQNFVAHKIVNCPFMYRLEGQ